MITLNSRMLRHLTLIVLVLLSGCSHRLPSDKNLPGALPPEEEWWINLPSCPMEFRVTPNKRLVALVNIAGKPIKQFRFVCLSGEKENRRVLRMLPPERRQFGTNDALFWGINVAGTELDPCRAGRLRTAVGEVQFEDGSIWKTKLPGID